MPETEDLNVRVYNIVVKMNHDYNALSEEERKVIRQFANAQKIETIWQAIYNREAEVPEEWKNAQLEWLTRCVDQYEESFMNKEEGT